jgi:hypothetical protein
MVPINPFLNGLSVPKDTEIQNNSLLKVATDFSNLSSFECFLTVKEQSHKIFIYTFPASISSICGAHIHFAASFSQCLKILRAVQI